MLKQTWWAQNLEGPYSHYAAGCNTQPASCAVVIKSVRFVLLTRPCSDADIRLGGHQVTKWSKPCISHPNSQILVLSETTCVFLSRTGFLPPYPRPILDPLVFRASTTATARDFELFKTHCTGVLASNTRKCSTGVLCPPRAPPFWN